MWLSCPSRVSVLCLCPVSWTLLWKRQTLCHSAPLALPCHRTCYSCEFPFSVPTLTGLGELMPCTWGTRIPFGTLKAETHNFNAYIFMAKYKFYINRIVFGISKPCLFLATQPPKYENFLSAHQNQCCFQTIQCYLNFNLQTFLKVSWCPRPGNTRVWHCQGL